MAEPVPFLVLARMWLRCHGDRPAGIGAAGRALIRYRSWAGQEQVDPLPMTTDAVRRHLAWVEGHFSPGTVRQAERYLSEFSQWLYEPLIEHSRMN